MRRSRTMEGIRLVRQEAAQMATRRKFGRYKKESPRITREPEIEQDALERLRQVWDAFDVSCGYTGHRGGEEHYLDEWLVPFVKDLVCSAADIERFSIMLTDLQDDIFFKDRAERMLRELLERGKDGRYIIHTGELQTLFSLPSGNTKTITVEGDINSVGRSMTGGRIHVKGNCHLSVGGGMGGGLIIVEKDVDFCDGIGEGMKGGEIIIKGDVSGAIGWSMKGGIIRILGDATGKTINEAEERAIGYEMKGGEVHLHGDYPGIGRSILGGKIYHKGKLIIDK
jgi:hypothetical protein